jgi:hypothetical protein
MTTVVVDIKYASGNVNTAAFAYVYVRVFINPLVYKNFINPLVYKIFRYVVLGYGSVPF